MMFLICDVLHPPIKYSHAVQNIFTALFANILSLRSFLIMSRRFSHLHKTKDVRFTMDSESIMENKMHIYHSF